MNPLTIIAALALVVFCCALYACWDADLRARFSDNDHDWREDWCCPECMAAHDQKEPCGDCPARRAARRVARWTR